MLMSHFCILFTQGQGYADKRKKKVVNQYRRERKKLLQESTLTSEVPPAGFTVSGGHRSNRGKAQDIQGSPKRKFQGGKNPKHREG